MNERQYGVFVPRADIPGRWIRTAETYSSYPEALEAARNVRANYRVPCRVKRLTVIWHLKLR